MTLLSFKTKIGMLAIEPNKLNSLLSKKLGKTKLNVTDLENTPEDLDKIYDNLTWSMVYNNFYYLGNSVRSLNSDFSFLERVMDEKENPMDVTGREIKNIFEEYKFYLKV